MAYAPAQPVEREHAVVLGLWGWVCLIARAIGIAVQLLLRLAVAVSGGKQRRHGRTVYKHMACDGMRAYQHGLSAVGIQNVLPSTRWMARRFARRHRLPYALVHLRGGTTAVRLGASRPSSSPPAKVLVLFHGGGYAAPALGQHIHLAYGFTEKPPDDVLVYYLQYALASETANFYPRQLQQAVVLLDHLLHAEGIPPSAITLVGDSAGGHLALGLLLHLAHPNPSVPALSLHGQQLAGAALLSPWILTAEKGAGLVWENKDKDVLHPASLDYWAQNFLGLAGNSGTGSAARSLGDPWSCPLTAPGHWWADLPVADLFVTYGEDEVLRDNVARFCAALSVAAGEGALGQGIKRTTAKCYPGEMHEHMIMNRFLRLNEPCQSETDYGAWLAAQMASRPPTPPADQERIRPP